MNCMAEDILCNEYGAVSDGNIGQLQFQSEVYPEFIEGLQVLAANHPHKDFSCGLSATIR